ncbi:MAG: DUF881 domain-containing protein [Armatimonadota bacterium]|nr:DUF881 domain-containing protein [Armatimonadota bacterium]
MPTRWQVFVAAFLAVVGFLVAAQLQSRRQLIRAGGLPTWRLQELAVLIRQQEEALARLEAEIDALRRQGQDYETALTAGRSLSEEMGKELEQFRLLLGLVAVRGPGVQVTVMPGASPPSGILPTDVQAQDLAGLLNELWAAGAEAVAVNGLRILATTPIRQDGTQIVLAGTRIGPPFRIEAIGNPAALRAALAIRGGFVEGLRAVGLRVDVHTRQRLRLAARSHVEPLRHARPATPAPP